MLILKDLQKKFGKQHILQGISHTFESGSKTVILGSNGSGKSTLVKILSGALEATENPPLFHHHSQEIPAADLGQYCTLAAPYLGLNPMFTLAETLDFHQKFCPFMDGFSFKQWIDEAGLSSHKNKRLNTYSSGMLQRVRLLLAIPSDRPILLLDEPTSNLDTSGISLYKALIQEYALDKTVIVASNYVSHEYEFSTEELILEKHY